MSGTLISPPVSPLRRRMTEEMSVWCPATMLPSPRRAHRIASSLEPAAVPSPSPAFGRHSQPFT
jgi:hypothetical protein